MIYQPICANRAREAAQRILLGRSMPLVWIESIDRVSGSRPEGENSRSEVEGEARQSGRNGNAQPQSGTPT